MQTAFVWRHFADDIFTFIFCNENMWISIKISIWFVYLISQCCFRKLLVSSPSQCQSQWWPPFHDAYMCHLAPESWESPSLPISIPFKLHLNKKRTSEDKLISGITKAGTCYLFRKVILNTLLLATLKSVFCALDFPVNVRGPGYLGLTRSISWLMMPWHLTSPGHQQPWYWLCRISSFLSYLRKDFNYLRRINMEKWHKM